MRQLGLRFYTLLNILIICAVGMIFIGMISLKITERFAIQGKIEGTKAIIKAFESTYYEEGKIDEGKEFLQKALEPGAWGVIKLKDKNIEFTTPYTKPNKKHFTSSLLNRVHVSRNSEIVVEGTTFLPFSTYKAYKIVIPIRRKGLKGAIFIYQPLGSFSQNIELSQRLLTTWIILFIFVIAIFGYYLLSKIVVQPVHKLISLTKEISKGLVPKNVNVGNISEINNLQEALLNMSKEIEHSKHQLEENIEDLEIANKKIIETQKELVTTEKMASLGKLSAGVSHEIGNPLSAISGYVEILKKQKNIDLDTKESYLDKILNEIDRINTIISTLIDYSKPKELNIQNIDVNEIIDEAVKILDNQGVFKNIDLKLKLENSPLPIKIDYHQLLQVFINLLLNSIDALNTVGKIEISSKLYNNATIQIVFKDNGMGIEDEFIDKIFDPFFTTKDPGQGTGLGLSISHRIIQQFDGNITVDSKPGLGTEFTITFPKNEGENAKSIVN